jgi:hypothetical protein
MQSPFVGFLKYMYEQIGQERARGMEVTSSEIFHAECVIS